MNGIRVLIATLLLLSGGAQAAPERMGPAAPPPKVSGPLEGAGRVTGRPLPRFATVKRAEVNVRRGPGLQFAVDWQFRQRGLPVEIVGEWGHWRRVRDVDGEGGWVHYIYLSGRRGVIAMEDMIPLRTRPRDGAPEAARAEAGTILHATRCRGDGWCHLAAQGEGGWARADALWGVRPDEAFD